MFTLIWITGFLIVSKIHVKSYFYIFIRMSGVNKNLVSHCPLVVRKEYNKRYLFFFSFIDIKFVLFVSFVPHIDVQCVRKLKLDWKWVNNGHERPLWDGEDCTGTYRRSDLLQISVLFTQSVDPHFRIAYISQHISGKTFKLHCLIKFGMNCLISKLAVNTH